MVSTSNFGKTAGFDSSKKPLYFNALSTVPGQNNISFSDVYLKRFKRFAQKIDRQDVVQIFCLLN